jgi:hypothetical protein
MRSSPGILTLVLGKLTKKTKFNLEKKTKFFSIAQSVFIGVHGDFLGAKGSAPGDAGLDAMQTLIFGDGSKKNGSRDQGDQIGRILADWAIAYILWAVFLLHKYPEVGLLYFHGKNYVLVSTKQWVGPFWTIFSRTHPVTLLSTVAIKMRCGGCKRRNRCDQDCQMLVFQTKNPNLGKFWKALL